MHEAAVKAIEFTQGRQRSDIDTDELLGLAVVRLIEIIGEAAKNVERATRESAPLVPWRAIAGTRDRLAHGYFDVDLDIVWQIIHKDLPALVEQLETLLELEPKD
jgi:uncharacterized protein with HEPN domain